jgi:hypothetical protein
MRVGISALISIVSSFISRRHSRRLEGLRRTFATEPKAVRHDRSIALAFAIAVGLSGLPWTAVARDVDGRYAHSPLKSWFESLRSHNGPCCSDADGTALSDVDWEARDGHYRVRIEGQWWDVPDEALIKEPNRAGRTMVWPVYYRELDRSLRVEIRCFMPGSMT